MYKKSILIISMLLFGMVAPFVVAADKYDFPLAEGTGESEVKTYDEGLWEDYLGKDLNPTDIWSGDSDKVGAKAKSTIKSWEEEDWDIWQILDVLNPDWQGDFEDQTGIKWGDIKDLPTSGGKTGEEIIESGNGAADGYSGFPGDNWEVWAVTRDKWDYVGKGEYKDDPDDEDDVFPIFKDPTKTEDLMNAANDINRAFTYLGAVLGGNSDPIAEAAAAAVGDIYDGDLITWMLFVDLGLPMAKPVADYTKAVMEGLDPGDWKFNSEKLTLTGEVKGEEDYVIKVVLSDFGTAKSITFKTSNDDDAEVIYQIESAIAIPGYELSLLFVFTAISAIGLIYLIMKKK
ncbi:MAG: hypothetical protein ACTSR8_00625 [Promethearchaeota archaeon]